METTTPEANEGHEHSGSSSLELLKTDLLGRVRVPPDKREAILDAFERSGMSGQAFAEYVGVKYPTFATWVQKRRKARGENPEPKAVKAPLALVEAVLDREESPSAPLEVEAPGGIKLRIARRDDIALAVELLRALQSSESC